MLTMLKEHEKILLKNEKEIKVLKKVKDDYKGEVERMKYQEIETKKSLQLKITEVKYKDKESQMITKETQECSL